MQIKSYDLIDDLIGPAFPYERYEAGPFADEEEDRRG